MPAKNSLIYWVILSLALHAAGLAWCPTPGSFRPPYPLYLVVDLFSGPATSGTGHSLNDSPTGGGKAAPSVKERTNAALHPPRHTAPILPSANHHNQLSPKPSNVRGSAKKKAEAAKPLPEDLTKANTSAKTAEPHAGRPDNADNYQGIATNSESSTDSTTDGKPGYGLGVGLGAGSGSGTAAGSGQGGRPGSGSPVETPFAYGSNPPPPYPSTARRRGWEGEVLLLVTVTAQGEVCKVAVKRSSGYRILDRAAVKAIYRWQFQAAHQNGLAVAGQVIVPIRFDIKEMLGGTRND